MWSRLISYTSLLVQITLALSIPLTPKPSVYPLYVFPNGTAAENLFVREDGSVLMTMVYPSAELYYFPTPDSTDPILLYNFPDSSAAYGITEYAPDTYAVCTGTFSRSGDVTNATGMIWKVDMTNFNPEEDASDTTSIRVSKLADLSNTGFLNGAETLDTNTVLVAESVRGVVYSIDTENGNYTVVLNDTSLAPNATGAVRLGVNGLRKFNDTLYFTNTNHRSVGKVRLTANGTAAGPYTTIATNILVDDLEVDPITGAIYIPSLTANEITYIAPNGSVSVLAGSLNSTDVPGPTSIRFARGSGHGRHNHHGRMYTRLLISTSGGIEYPINGTYIQGGGLYELDVTRQYARKMFESERFLSHR